jgi:hypothetical protein
VEGGQASEGAGPAVQGSGGVAGTARSDRYPGELRQLIWPEASFGDFDHAINLAVTKLRATLGDSADVPHLIETLPRRGYRFIAPLKNNLRSLLRSSPHRRRSISEGCRKKALADRWGLGSILLFAATLFQIFPTLQKQLPTASEIVPLVSMPGLQGNPALSPDGSQVAFAYGGASHPGIYVALIGDKPLQLTNNGDDNYPTWSPDGRQIAFARVHADNQKSLYVIPALGGSERRVYSGSAPTYDCNRMDWSPDESSLIFSEGVDNGTEARLSLLSLSD